MHMENQRYDDIINLPHHVSSKRPQMPILERAAQFLPFSALTGYEDAVKETARLTDTRIELEESEKDLLNAKLHVLLDNLATEPKVKITYFLPDGRKSGGKYVSKMGTVIKIDLYNRQIKLEDETVIPLDDIFAIEENVE